jgi:hypothetical protein
MVPDFTEVPRAGQRARDGDGEHEDEQVAAAPPLARIRDPRQHLQLARDLPVLLSIGAGHSGSGSMRN